MKASGINQKQFQKVKTQPGFIAALDQSGGSTPGALKAYGIKQNAWSNAEEMFLLVHQPLRYDKLANSSLSATIAAEALFCWCN